MTRKVGKRTNRPGNTVKRPATAASRDTTVDDVIQDLLSLFKFLGLDSGHLATRVRDLGKAPKKSDRPYPHASAIGDLLTMWHEDPDFLDDIGNPKPIKVGGAGQSFRKLAEKSVPNMSANQLLRELEHLKAVTVDGRGKVHALVRSINVYEDKRLAALHTLNSLRGFINTLRHNLESAPSNSDQLFHRVAWNGELDAKEIPKLKIWLRRHGQNLLESADSWMSSKSRHRPQYAKRPKGSVQVSVGLYLAVDKSIRVDDPG